MAEEIVTFDADGRRRIRETVGIVLGGGDQNGRGPKRGIQQDAGYPFEVKLGKADADIAKGASGTVSEYRGTTAGSESDTTLNYTVYCRFGAVSSGKWVLFIRLYGHWEAIAAEC